MIDLFRDISAFRNGQGLFLLCVDVLDLKAGVINVFSFYALYR